MSDTSTNTEEHAEDSDDELPCISVNTSALTATQLCMPSAEEVAKERERAAECERELAALRPRLDSELTVASIARSDSSGSEGEAALAATLQALACPGAEQQQNEPEDKDALDKGELSLIVMLEKMEARLSGAGMDSTLLCAIIQTLKATPLSSQRAVFSQMVSSMAQVSGSWGGSAAAGACACAAAAAVAVRPAVAALRAVLTHAGTEQQRAAAVAVSAAGARTALAASDAAREGLSAGAFARVALRAALCPHTQDAVPCEELTVEELSTWARSSFHSLKAREQVHALRVIARVLASEDIERRNEHARRTLLETLTARAQHKHRLDKYKVSLAVSRINLMFGTRAPPPL